MRAVAELASEPKKLFGYRKYWAKRFGIAPFLPMSRAEMDVLGWDSCDVIIVTGDAYIDHPSFGMALVGRLLEAQGFRVGIIAQPDWRSAEAFRALGKPNLFYGITAGNMDSMVNRYTADRKIRSKKSFKLIKPGGENEKSGAKKKHSSCSSGLILISLIPVRTFTCFTLKRLMSKSSSKS